MASAARWKRFPFFERRNLSLPPSVTRDLLPSKSPSSSNASSRGGTVDGAGLDPDALYRDDDGEPTSDDRRRIGRGEYFSFVAASGAALPASLNISGEDEDLDEDVAGAVATRRGAGGDGAPAMRAGLAALRGPPTIANGASTTGRGGGSNATTTISGGGALVLLFASSRRTPRVHCIDVTVRCTPSNPHAALPETTQQAAGAADNIEGGGSSDNNSRGNSAFASSAIGAAAGNAPSDNATADNPEELDGWRGHYDPFASCGGVVAGGSGSKGGVSKTTVISPSRTSKPPTAAGKAAKGGRRKEQRILDEHLGGDLDAPTSGGGGALFGSSPFAGNGTAESSPGARIVGLAACVRSPPPSQRNGDSTLYVAAITDAPGAVGIVVHANPHLMLSSLPPSSASNAASKIGAHSWHYAPTAPFDFATHGRPRCVTILPGVVGVGTDRGKVLLYVFHCDGSNKANAKGGGKLSLVAEIPAPRATAGGGGEAEERKDAYSVSRVELIGLSAGEGNGGSDRGIHRLFVSYRKRCAPPASGNDGPTGPAGDSAANAPGGTSSPSSGPSGGVCCYDLGGLRIPGRSLPSGAAPHAPVVSARYDLDGRDCGGSCLCDGVRPPPAPPSFGTSRPAAAEDNADTNADAAAPPASHVMEKMLPRFAVARNDGIHLYSPEEKVGVCPIDGDKLAICALPPPPVVYLRRPVRPPLVLDGDAGSSAAIPGAGASHALVAATDAKSNRDAVDVYDTTHKLVGFHVLLSPGHRALRAVGTFSPPAVEGKTLLRGGRTGAAVLTSGGSVVTVTEKATPDKVELLAQKHLYGAAVSMAYADPQFYRPEDVTALHRRHAEHLYRRGEFGAAMEQYVLTIGSLEPSHVVFRFLGAPKIPLAVKYLEALRRAGLAANVHDELLRTCYLKLGDVDAASKIVLASPSSCDAPLRPDGSEAPSVPIARNLLACADDPSEMLAAICSLEAPAAVAALAAHGVLIARSLPRETAGVVIALCDGSYSPTAAADAAAGRSPRANDGGSDSMCEKYPIGLFGNAFMENPKLFRLILSHCRRNDCVLTPMLRRTLLELTLDEWNAAKRTGDLQVQKLRHDEAISMLSENHVDDMGDYEALVIVQAANFTEGEILLYERLNMIPMLLDEYAKRGDARSRRQMLAMCEAQHDDSDLFAEVLAHFVAMAGERLNKDSLKEEASVSSESDIGGLLHDIHEALVMARDDHVDVPPVRILRILAGEGPGMFSADNHNQSGGNQSCGVPLSAAMDYVGAVLDSSDRKIHRLKNNVEEYSRLCSDMESEISALLSPGTSPEDSEAVRRNNLPNVDIDDMYSNLLQLEEEGGQSSSTPFSARGGEDSSRLEMAKEDFWRDMEHSDDPFETICFYMSKGCLENM